VTATLELVRAGRTRRARSRSALTFVLAALVLALAATSLMVGQTFYSPGEVLRVLIGQDVPGA
jgi:iron complex transport system permease protein